MEINRQYALREKSKNRVWHFFSNPCECIGKKVPLSLELKRDKSRSGYDIASGRSNYYLKDHLGSIREVINSNGTTVESRYDYSPYGNVTKITGTGEESDFRYTGHFYHGTSGLHLTLYRAYDSGLGRWLSRDPIEEDGGLNLYGYVFNNPVNYWDPLGLRVLFRTRDLNFPLGGVGAHSWTEIINSSGRTTYTGTEEKDKRLGVKRNHPPDYNPSESNPITASWVVPPPPGMTQAEWDEAVKESAERERKLDEKRGYGLFGGDGGNESGNCHSVTRRIIEGAGGNLPEGYNPPGLNPSLRK